MTRPHPARSGHSAAHHARCFPTPFAFIALWSLGTLAPPVVLHFEQDDVFLIHDLRLDEQVFPALALMLCGLICTLLGYVLAGSSGTPPRRTGRINTTYTQVVWLIAFCTIILLMGRSPAEIAATSHALVSKVRDAAPGQTLIFTILPIMSIHSCFLSLAAIQHGARFLYWRAALVAFLSAALAFLIGSRLSAILVLLAPAIYLATKARLKPSLIISVGLLAISLVYFGDQVRAAAQKRDLRASPGAIATFASSYSLVDPMAMVVDLRRRIHPEPISSTITILRWNLPSNIAGYKEPIGPLLARYVYYHDMLGGITFGMFGEFYYYYGLGGLIFLSVLLGFVLKHLTRATGAGDARGAMAAIMLCTLLFSTLRDGPSIDIQDIMILVLSGYLQIYLSIRHYTPKRRPQFSWRRLQRMRADALFAAER